jgi:sugar phosphate isomerase/epimerase
MADRLLIGNQTAFFAPVLDPFRFAVQHDFNAFEFFPDGGPLGRGWSAEEVTVAERMLIRTTAHAHQIRLSVHAALDAGPLDGIARVKLLRDVDLARDIGARVVNMHLVPDDVEAFCRTTLSLVDELAPSGITLALENTIAIGPKDVNRMFAGLQALDAERAHGIGLCLDIGHANLHHATHNDYLGYVDALAEHVPIVHAHLHENWGDGDRHLTLFTGPASRDPSGIAGLLRRLRRRRYAGSLILEQWPTPPTLLVTARDRLQALQPSDGTRSTG